MKKLVLSFVITMLCILSIAQVPESFNYQAIPRNSSGGEYPSQAMKIRINILSGSPTGSSVYCETFAQTTTSLGILNLQIGQGTPVSGNFTIINWGVNSLYLKVEIDPNGGTNYVEMGTTQLLSVPYALYAKTVASYTETDPVFVAWNKSTGISITASQVSDFQTSVTNNAAVLTNTAKNSYPTADATKLADITGTNTGDETAETIKSKLGITTLSGSNTGDQNLASVLTQGTDAGNKKIINVNQQGIGTSTPDASAALEISSTTQGFLLPRMTEAQMYALTPVEGLIVYNTTSKNLNFYGDGKWYEFTDKVCVPQPTTANAGPNQNILVTITTLAGNTPVYGMGTWTITAGTGGSIDDIHSPNSIFTGSLGNSYVLNWTISTPCNTSFDNVNISLGPSCSNGILDGTETDLDCGGPTCPKCANGLRCVMNSDCVSGNCSALHCL